MGAKKRSAPGSGFWLVFYHRLISMDLIYREKMKKSKLMILIFFLTMIFSCQREKNPVTPPGGGNIHPQVAIPWPSLADSPWPIAHGNMQCTGRSSFKGPQEGKVSWRFTEEHMVDLLCSPVIGEDGTIYFTSNRSLYALNPNGTLKWKTRDAGGFEGGGYSSISMSPDGSVLYIAGLDSTLNAVSAETSDIL